MTISELIHWLKENEYNRVKCVTVEERYEITRVLVDNGCDSGDYARSVLKKEADTHYMHPFLHYGKRIEYFSANSNANHCIEFSEIELENMEMPDLEEFV